MRVSILNVSEDQNIIKSKININDLNVLLKITEIFDMTF